MLLTLLFAILPGTLSRRTASRPISPAFPRRALALVSLPLPRITCPPMLPRLPFLFDFIVRKTSHLPAPLLPLPAPVTPVPRIVATPPPPIASASTPPPQLLGNNRFLRPLAPLPLLLRLPGAFY